MRNVMMGIAAISVAGAALPAMAAPVFFDDFMLQQRAQSLPSADNPNTTTVTTPNGQRTFSTEITTADGSPGEADVVLESGVRRANGSGTLAYSEAAGMTGVGIANYTGSYDFSSANSIGLGFIGTDNPFNLAVEVEDSDGDMSMVSRVLTSADNGTNQRFDFGSFSSDIDFGSLTMLSLRIDNEDITTAVDAQFDSISVNRVPVPAAGVLLVGGLGALGLMGRRRKS